MTLNPQLKSLFLPLLLALAASATGALKANAEEPTTQLAVRQIALAPQASSRRDTQVVSRVKETIRPIAGGAAAIGRVELAQLSPTTPTTPNNIPPDSAVPGTIQPSTTTPGAPTIQQPGSVPTTPETTPGVTPQTTPGTEAQPLLQTPDVAPGRATQSGSSYIGVGGNIGIDSGDTTLGQGSFAVLSKIGLTRNISVRPSVLFTDNVSVLVPLTYDFNFGAGPTESLGFSAAPFLGVGAGFSTGNNSNVGLLLTGGIDVPITPQFTATASVNATVTGRAAVGLLLGVGYNFAGF